MNKNETKITNQNKIFPERWKKNETEWKRGNKLRNDGKGESSRKILRKKLKRETWVRIFKKGRMEWNGEKIVFKSGSEKDRTEVKK